MKNPCSFRIPRAVFAALTATLLSALPALAGTWTATRDRADGVYATGEPIHWTIAWSAENGEAPLLPAAWQLKAGGLTVIDSGSIEPPATSAEITSTLDAPNTLLLEVTWKDGDAEKSIAAGAVADPDRIEAITTPPEDFDAFWAEKIAELRAVPANAELTPAESDRDGVHYWKITMDNIRGAKIHGQLARPAEGDTFPALFIPQWAGVYPLQKAWATDRAAEGWLVLNLIAHDLPIDEPEAFYEAQREGPLKDYWKIGNADRETSYFLRMYLSCVRAVDYLKSRPDWNGRTLVVMGTSQGGQQTLATAGLCPDITAALALVPAGADLLAPSAGRAAGFPPWYDQFGDNDPEIVRNTSRYFDIANFAPHIRAPMLIGVGLRDKVCPPAGIFAAANRIGSFKEIAILPDSGHQNENGSQEPYNRRCYQDWLPALRRGLKPPENQSARERHTRLLRRLGIDRLRPGADPGNPVGTAPGSPPDSETLLHSLPDPLKAADGTPIRTPDAWREHRRPELLEIFAREVYGRVPATAPAVSWEVVSETRDRIANTVVVIRHLRGNTDNRAYPFLQTALELTLKFPADQPAAVPAILHFGWPPEILARFPRPDGPSWEEMVIAHGWAAATVIPTSFQADSGAGLNRGVIGIASRGADRAPDEWGTLRAWAWGASRALDYLESATEIDGTRVGIEGLSRYGKAALVAMAFDERFAVAMIGSSGAGGAKLFRHSVGEKLENLASAAEYHWMAGNFLRYAGPLTVDDLPVDAHELLALCAPRPVFLSCGAPEVEGTWIDQRGTFLAAVAASPVYALLGAHGLGSIEYPPAGAALTDGELAWRQHHGGHTTLPNWPVFLNWADRYLCDSGRRR